MTKPKFKWMVIHHVDKRGIHFETTDGSGSLYVFYWNPLRVLSVIFRSKDWALGLFPMMSKHIKGEW